jgi:periplasmic divalent cation tolerance protein
LTVNDYLQVCTTADSHATATKLAKVAASAQIHGPVDSFFWHQGESGKGQEWQVTLKTTAVRYPALEALLLREHPWDNPEITATPLVRGSASYFAWLERTVNGD